MFLYCFIFIIFYFIVSIFTIKSHAYMTSLHLSNYTLHILHQLTVNATWVWHVSCVIMCPSSHSCPCRTVTSPGRFLLFHTQEDTLNSIARVTQWEHAEKTLLHLLQVKLKPRQPQEASASWCCFFIVSALTDTKWKTDFQTYTPV